MNWKAYVHLNFYCRVETDELYMVAGSHVHTVAVVMSQKWCRIRRLLLL